MILAKVEASQAFNALSYGVGWQELIAGRGLLGHVVAVFQRTFYVRTVNGRLVCIAHKEVDDGPLTLRVEFPEHFSFNTLGIKPKTLLLSSDEGDLQLDDKVVLQLSEVRSWSPPELDEMALPEQILDRLRLLSCNLSKIAPSDGLAPLIAHVEGIVLGEEDQPFADSNLLGCTFTSLVRLIRGAIIHDRSDTDVAIKGLIGLGPGLTPSGDDLLGGFMVALITTLKTSGIANSTHPRLTGDLAESISYYGFSNTTDISASLLEFAAKGLTSASVHRLIRKLLQRGSSDDTFQAALSVAEVGHSSGWDCLVGILLGAHLALRLRDSRCVSEEYNTLSGKR